MTSTRPAIALLSLTLLTAAGCGGGGDPRPPSDGPAAPLAEAIGPMHVVCTSQALAESIAVDTITRTTDPTTGIMHLSVPIRARTSADFTVDYRFTFFDANRVPVDDMNAWQAFPLHAGTFDHIDAVAPSRRATDFELDLRFAQ